MSKRPKSTSMEGMIWNANHVLDTALSVRTNGIPKHLVHKCKGVVLLTVHEVGIVMSGSSGTGVVVAQTDPGNWSAPSAIGMQGAGMGFMAGYASKDMIILIMKEDDLRRIASAKFQFPATGSQIVDTWGKVDRNGRYDTNEENAHGSYAFVFSKGVFSGISTESARLIPHPKQNAKFYKKEKVTAEEILFGDAVDVPGECGIPDLHRKLEALRMGETKTPTAAEEEKKERLRTEAEKAAEDIRDELGEDVQAQDIQEETAKEET